MAHVIDEEDDDRYGHYETKRRGMKWTTGKVIFTIFLFGISAALIFTGIYPIIDMDYDLKNFCNLLLVLMHGFYMFGFTSVKRKGSFIFWSSSFLLLDAITFLFYFYEDIFF